MTARNPKLGVRMLCLCASDVVCAALRNNRHFRFAAPLSLLFQPILYCGQVLFGIGWGTRRLGLLRRLDQLKVSVA